jgi:hypothetical protein
MELAPKSAEAARPGRIRAPAAEEFLGQVMEISGLELAAAAAELERY